MYSRQRPFVKTAHTCVHVRSTADEGISWEHPPISGGPQLSWLKPTVHRMPDLIFSVQMANSL